jgi:hypothetical protein
MIYTLTISFTGGVAMIIVFVIYNRAYKQFARKHYPDNYKKYSLYPVGWSFVFKADPKLDAECKRLTANFLLVSYVIWGLVWLLLLTIEKISKM